jgi:hypothetical protein
LYAVDFHPAFKLSRAILSEKMPSRLTAKRTGTCHRPASEAPMIDPVTRKLARRSSV